VAKTLPSCVSRTDPWCRFFSTPNRVYSEFCVFQIRIVPLLLLFLYEIPPSALVLRKGPGVRRFLMHVVPLSAFTRFFPPDRVPHAKLSPRALFRMRALLRRRFFPLTPRTSPALFSPDRPLTPRCFHSRTRPTCQILEHPNPSRFVPARSFWQQTALLKTSSDLLLCGTVFFFFFLRVSTPGLRQVGGHPLVLDFTFFTFSRCHRAVMVFRCSLGTGVRKSSLETTFLLSP